MFFWSSSFGLQFAQIFTESFSSQILSWHRWYQMVSESLELESQPSGQEGHLCPCFTGTVKSKSLATPQKWVLANHSHQKPQSALEGKQVMPFKTKSYNAEYVNSSQKSTAGEKLFIFVSLKRFQQRVSLNVELAQSSWTHVWRRRTSWLRARWKQLTTQCLESLLNEHPSARKR